MNPLTVVACGENTRLNETLGYALDGVLYERLPQREALPKLAGKRVLFALALSEHGLDADVSALIAYLRAHSQAMEGSIGAILIDSAGELFT